MKRICFFSAAILCIEATNIENMSLVCVLSSCVTVSLTRDIILPCQRQDCHKATRLSVRLGCLAEGLMEVFMHVSQLAGNNLHVMSGPRRQPTCWAAPWRSSPPPSSSTRPRAPCPEPAVSARLLTKMAQETQVLHTQTTCTNTLLSSLLTASCSPFPLSLSLCLLLPHPHTYIHTHGCIHTHLCSSPERNCML